MKLPPGGGEPVTLVREQNHPSSLGVQDGAFYWGVGPLTRDRHPTQQEIDTPQNHEMILRLTIP